MTRKYLDDAYDASKRGEVRELYDVWAGSYDAELDEAGYATPLRAAEMLAKAGTPVDVTVLDYGCGTGLSGAALAYWGYTDLHGADLSPRMLAEAEAKQIYGKLWTIDPEAPLPVYPGDYGVIAAVGVISPGAGPASLIATLSDLLLPGGLLLFSFNDHALADPDYMAALDACRGEGGMETVAEEHGEHLPGRDMKSTLYLLRKG